MNEVSTRPDSYQLLFAGNHFSRDEACPVSIKMISSPNLKFYSLSENIPSAGGNAFQLLLGCEKCAIFLVGP